MNATLIILPQVEQTIFLPDCHDLPITCPAPAGAIISKTKFPGILTLQINTKPTQDCVVVVLWLVVFFLILLSFPPILLVSSFTFTVLHYNLTLLLAMGTTERKVVRKRYTAL